MAGTAAWRDALSADALQLVAEGVATFAGFRVVTIVVVRGAWVECVAVAGCEDSRRALLGSRAPARLLGDLIDASEDWGLLRFVPHERWDAEPVSTSRAPGGNDAGAWRPRDGLLVPLYDADGVLRGALSVDEPLDGRRPGAQQRALLERYTVHALRTMLTTLEREELAERIEVAAAARRVVRAASGELSLADVLGRSRTALLEGFGADDLWWRLFSSPGSPSPAPDGDGMSGPPGMDPRIEPVATAIALHAWRAQEVVVAHSRLPLPPAATRDPAVERLCAKFLARPDIESLLLVPMGAGEECVGLAVMHRRDGTPWTPVEAEEALDVGHDLGRAVLNARTYERELDLVQRLRTVDAYKSQLISTVSHELRTPLTSVVGNLELMEDLLADDDSDTTLSRAAAASRRGARRLVALVEDLLLLSHVADPDAAARRAPVDLHDVVADVVQLNSAAAQEKRTEITVRRAPVPALVMGDAAQLDRVLVNLVSNAVKYSPPGSSVRLEVRADEQTVVVTCSDDGYGISEEDQQNLFREFFRSDNPRVRAATGTGLGLAIAQRVVTSHGGRIELTSRLGAGSTFRVVLPRAGT